MVLEFSNMTLAIRFSVIIALLQSASYTSNGNWYKYYKTVSSFEMIMNYNDNKLYVKFGLIF